MNFIFPLVALGGVAALFFASSSSASTPSRGGGILPGSSPADCESAAKTMADSLAKNGDMRMKNALANGDYLFVAALFRALGGEAGKVGKTDVAGRLKTCADYFSSKSSGGDAGGGGENLYCEKLIEGVAQSNPGFKAIMAKKDYIKAASILQMMSDGALKTGAADTAAKYQNCAKYLSNKPGAVTPDIELTVIDKPGGGGGGVPVDEAGWVADENAINSAQICLVNLGFLDSGGGEVDGKLGPHTKAALLAFQKKYSLKQQTGELTRETAELVCTKVDKSAYDTAEGERWKIKGSDKETETSAYNLGYEAGQADKTSEVAQNMAWGHDTFASLGVNIQAAGQTGYNAGYTGAAKKTLHSGGPDLGYGTGPDTDVRGDAAVTGLPSIVRYDAYGRPVVQRISIADLYPQSVGRDGRLVSSGPGRRPEPRR